MIDTSDDAIEADLERAARGGPATATWLAWAQVRATLATRTAGPASEATGRPAFQPLPVEGGSPDIEIAQGPFGASYAVPATASWEDRVTAAAMMLGVPSAVLADGLAYAGAVPDDAPTEPAWEGPVPPEGETTVDVPLEPILVAPDEPDFELDIDDDGTLDDLEKDDDIDSDFAKIRKPR